MRTVWSSMQPLILIYLSPIHVQNNSKNIYQRHHFQRNPLLWPTVQLPSFDRPSASSSIALRGMCTAVHVFVLWIKLTRMFHKIVLYFTVNYIISGTQTMFTTRVLVHSGSPGKATRSVRATFQGNVASYSIFLRRYFTWCHTFPTSKGKSVTLFHVLFKKR